MLDYTNGPTPPPSLHSLSPVPSLLKRSSLPHVCSTHRDDKSRGLPNVLGHKVNAVARDALRVKLRARPIRNVVGQRGIVDAEWCREIVLDVGVDEDIGLAGKGAAPLSADFAGVDAAVVEE